MRTKPRARASKPGPYDRLPGLANALNTQQISTGKLIEELRAVIDAAYEDAAKQCTNCPWATGDEYAARIRARKAAP